MKNKKIISLVIVALIGALVITALIINKTKAKGDYIESSNENVNETQKNDEENEINTEIENHNLNDNTTKVIENIASNEENSNTTKNNIVNETKSSSNIKNKQQNDISHKTNTNSRTNCSTTTTQATTTNKNNGQAIAVNSNNQNINKIDLSKYSYYEKGSDGSYKGFIEDKGEINKIKNLIDSAIKNFGYKNVKTVVDSSLAKSGARYFTANKTNVDNLVYDSDGFGIYYYAVKEYIISKDGTESYFQTRSYIKVK